MTINPVNKGTGWSNSRNLPQVAESDGTYSEGVSAWVKAWNTVTLAYQKLSANNATGGLEVHVVGGTVATTGGGGAVTMADGANVTQGATADAAVVTDTTGTVSGKLRGLVKWAFERMPASLGQKAMAASLPVTIASDQSSYPVAATQGTAAAAAGAWPVKTTDGTNTAAVKAASTAPIATDPALVVSLSPNSPAPGTQTVDTELPAPILLGDAMANPTVPQVGAHMLGYDASGAVWQRLRYLGGGMATVLQNSSGTQATIRNIINDVTGAEDALNVNSINRLFNGSVWERQRNNLNTTTGDSGAKTTGTFAGATQTNYNHRGAYITCLLGTVTGAVTTWQTGLEFSYDGGTTWLGLTALGANDTAAASGRTYTWLVYPTNTSQAAGTTPATLVPNGGPTQLNIINAALPRTWRFKASVTVATSIVITSVNVNYIV